MAQSDLTLIRNGVVVAFDGSAHRIIPEGYVAFRGDEIVSVGRRFEGEADIVIDAAGKLVIPGLISVHAHATTDIGARAIVDAGRRDLWKSGFLNFEPRRGPQMSSFWRAGDVHAGLRYGLACMLRGGATTVVELGGAEGIDHAEMLDLAADCGIRLYYGPTFSSGYFRFDERDRIALALDDAAAERAFRSALAFLDAHRGANEGRFNGVLVLSGFVRTPRRLFEDVKAAARERGLPVTLHVAESVWEFQHTVNTRGRTPIEVLHDWGVLGPDVILGHSIFVGGHSQTAWPHLDDLRLIAASGASVAHAPITFARRGVAMESLQRYLDHGINVAFGTDTYPLDILEEMRTASLVSKVVDRDFESAHARDIFNAATLGGAKALGRDDLGRLAPGARADIVLVDTQNLRMSPYHDPIRALVYCATGDQVDRVIVAGRSVVDKGALVAWSTESLLADAERAARAVVEDYPNFDPAGRTMDEAYPPCFRPWDGE